MGSTAWTAWGVQHGLHGEYSMDCMGSTAWTAWGVQHGLHGEYSMDCMGSTAWTAWGVQHGLHGEDWEHVGIHLGVVGLSIDLGLVRALSALTKPKSKLIRRLNFFPQK